MNLRQILKLYVFNWINISAVALVFFFLWVLGASGLKFEFFDVIGEVFKDFELTDSYYTKTRVDVQGHNNAAFEDQVVLVNIGKLNRIQIAQMIETLNLYDPLSIGIDATFLSEKSYEIDSTLGSAISKVKNFVLAARVQGNQDPNTKVYDTLVRPRPLVAGKSNLALVNTGLHSSEGRNFLTWRSFNPLTFVKSDDKKRIDTLEFLGVKVASFLKPENVKKFYARQKESEDIYFRGNVTYGNLKFTVLNWDQVLDTAFTEETIKGKVILMGYMGEDYQDYFVATTRGDASEFAFDEDRFYTPMNIKTIGRGEPDMYGVVVHANIASMIINNTYINEMPAWLSWLIAVLVCFFNVCLFAYIINSNKLGIWYNALSKGTQLIQLILVVTLTYFMFNEYQYKVELSLTSLVIALSGDLTEIYIDLIVNSLRRSLKF
jgi:CHASE2 domain-containing sensor protein